jgi:rRNA maturation endonuclease Nob1
MPSHYWYHCKQCDYRAYRYRNVKRCPDCGGNLVREQSEGQAQNPLMQAEKLHAQVISR